MSNDLEITLELNSLSQEGGGEEISLNGIVDNIKGGIGNSVSLNSESQVMDSKVVDGILLNRLMGKDDPHEEEIIAQGIREGFVVDNTLTDPYKEKKTQESLIQLENSIKASLDGEGDIDSVLASQSAYDRVRNQNKSIQESYTEAVAEDPINAEIVGTEKRLMELTLAYMDAKAIGDLEKAQQLENSINFIINPSSAGAIDVAAYGPEDVVAGIVSMGMISLMKQAGISIFSFGANAAKGKGKAAIQALKGNLSNISGRELLKSTGVAAMWEGTAGSIVHVLDQKYDSTLINILGGILGPIGVAGLATMSKRGVQSVVAKIAATDPDGYKKLITEAGKVNSEFANLIKTPIAGTDDLAVSPVAKEAVQSVLLGDTGLQNAVVDKLRFAQASQMDVGALRNALGKAIDAGDALPVIPVMMGNRHALTTDVMSPLAKQLNNASLLSNSVGHRVLYKELSEKQEKIVDGVSNIRVYANTFDFGPSNIGWERGNHGGVISRMLGSQLQVLKKKATDLVLDATFFEQQASRVAKQYKQLHNQTVKGLSTEEKNLLGSIMDQINQTGKRPLPAPDGFWIGDMKIKASPQVMDAYYANRILLDSAWEASNQATIGQLKHLGYKWDDVLKGPVREKGGVSFGTRDSQGVEWTQDLHKRGARIWENPETKEFRIILDQDRNPLRDISKSDRVLSYEKDYIPIIYKDDWRILAIKMDDSGKIVDAGPVATAPNQKAAMEAVKAMKTSDANVHYIASRQGNDVVDISAVMETHDYLHKLSPGELKQLAIRLEKAGIDPATVNSFKDSITPFSYKKTSHLLERGSRLKKGSSKEVAEMLPSLEAIEKYLHAAGHYASKSEYQTAMKNKFLETYGHMLHNKLFWDSDIATKNQSTQAAFSAKEVKEARDVQRQLRTILAQPDPSVARQVEIYDSLERKLLDKDNYYAQKMGEAMMYLPRYTTSGAVAGAKAVTSQLMLRMFAIDQLLVQGTGMLNTLGSYAGKPVILTKALEDARRVITGVGDGGVLKRLYQESGFGSMVNFASLEDASQAISKMSKGGQLVGNAAGTFYNMGEAGNQLLAWAAARQNLIAEVKKGTLKLPIDSPEFLRMVSRDAQKTALNMTRFNQPAYTRGALGIPTQFFQFATHQAETMLSGRLNAMQRAGIWAFWIGAFGTRGVPFIQDAIMLGDSVAEWTGNPDYVGASERMLENTFGEYARGLSRNEFFDVANRVGIGSFMQGFYDGVDLSDLSGAAGSVFLNTLVSVNSMKELYEHISDERNHNMWDIANNFTRPARGVNNLVRGARAMSEGMIYSGTNRPVKEVENLHEVIFTAIGLSPSEVTKIRESNALKFRVNGAWRNWVSKTSQEIAETLINDPSAAGVLLQNSFEYIAEYDPRLASRLKQEISWKYQRLIVPENLRVVFDQMMDKAIGKTLPETYMLKETKRLTGE